MEPRVRAPQRRQPGGILELVVLIGEHRPALRYDFRDRFGVSLDAVGTKHLPWAEAIDLATGLASDPSTRICAELNEWDYPFSRVEMLLADIFDLQNIRTADPKKASRIKPHPIRPWKSKNVQKFGNTGGRTRDQVVAILDAAARGQLAA